MRAIKITLPPNNEGKEKPCNQYREFIIRALESLTSSSVSSFYYTNEHKVRTIKKCLEERIQKIRADTEKFDHETAISLEAIEPLYEELTLRLEPSLAIVALTQEVTIPYRDPDKSFEGKKKAGKYQVTIKFSDFLSSDIVKSVLIKPGSSWLPIPTYPSYIHPHIRLIDCDPSLADGAPPCWGLYSYLLASLLQEMLIFDVLILVYSFLSHVHLPSCYDKNLFFLFPEVENGKQ